MLVGFDWWTLICLVCVGWMDVDRKPLCTHAHPTLKVGVKPSLLHLHFQKSTSYASCFAVKWNVLFHFSGLVYFKPWLDWPMFCKVLVTGQWERSHQCVIFFLFTLVDFHSQAQQGTSKYHIQKEGKGWNQSPNYSMYEEYLNHFHTWFHNLQIGWERIVTLVNILYKNRRRQFFTMCSSRRYHGYPSLERSLKILKGKRDFKTFSRILIYSNPQFP